MQKDNIQYGAWGINQIEIQEIQPKISLGQWENVKNEPKQIYTKQILDQIGDMAQERVQQFIQNARKLIQLRLQSNKKIIDSELIKDFQGLDDELKKILSDQKEKMNLWVRLKIEEILINILEDLRPTLKESLKDPYMCECVKQLIDNIFDEIWPDIQEEILFELKLKISEPYSDQLNKKPIIQCYSYPWFWFRAWYLYTVDPFDQSIWQQFRNIFWYLIFAIRLIPFYGIQSFLYIIVFLCLDKSDEFQLINFILCFKRMQFISLGVIGTMIGYFTFYSCSSNNLKNYDCKQYGVVVYFNDWADIIGFLLQIILVWIAWICLQFSKVKGKPKFTYSKSNSDVINEKKLSCCFCLKCKNRASRLKYFLIYDFITFTCCIGLFFILSSSHKKPSIWQYKADIYLVKTIYGILSFPFTVFLIPGITYLLTHSYDTAYDKFGNCVPKIPNLKQYHKQIEHNNKINKNGFTEIQNYDKKYTQLPDREVLFREKIPLMNELV